MSKTGGGHDSAAKAIAAAVAELTRGDHRPGSPFEVVIADVEHAPELIVVVTDPNGKLWSGWECRGAYLTVSPNELATGTLAKYGVERQKLLTIGMPVDPEFLHPSKQTREMFLESLQLSSELPTLCLTAGSAGGGNTLAIYKALVTIQNIIQIIVICGDNIKLARAVKAASLKGRLATAIVDKLPSMSDVMNACDLLVTKAGGLTTYEAIARRLPMAIDMITEPMPQEIGTTALLIDAGLATGINNPEEILPLAESLRIRGRAEPPLPLPTEYNLDRTDSVYEIANLILSNCHVHNVANSCL